MDEPNALMRWVMFHFAGGDALWVALCGLAVISVVPERKASAWRWTALVVLMLVWGGLSSPAWPSILFLLSLGVVSGWRTITHRSGCEAKPALRAALMIRGLCLALAVWEFSATGHFHPAVPPQTLCVIADSVTAGLNDGEHTWPQRFAEQTGIAVRDASQPGATFKSALKQAELLDDEESPLVLEIGGNDLLSGLSLSEFTRDLEALCRQVCTPGRVVWMCELPLPPLSSGYGTAQRRICRHYGIWLIPRRNLMRVLSTAGATTDSIHLSPEGQELFCKLMVQATGAPTRRDAVPGRYERIEPGIRKPVESAAAAQPHYTPFETGSRLEGR